MLEDMTDGTSKKSKSKPQRQEGDVVLRILTERSVLGVLGPYQYRTVENIIHIGKKYYLRSCYFNMEKISFKPEVLEKIGVPKEYYITKPGTNKELGKKLEEEIRKEKKRENREDKI